MKEYPSEYWERNNMDRIVITEQGKQLSVKAASSNKAVRFLRVSIGAGVHEEEYNPEEITELINYKMDGMISKCEANGNTVNLTAQFSSLEVEEGFYATEIGIYAEEDIDGAEELLFAYFDMNTDPQYIYGCGGGVQKLVEMDMAMVLSNTNIVTANICPGSIIYREEFSKEILEIKGRVNDIEYPEYEEAGELEEIKNGDGINGILGKVRKAIKELILHIGNKGNPHTVTPEQLGIESGANNYMHPDVHPASIITQDTNHRFVTDTQIGSWNGKMEKDGNSAENTAVYTSGDNTNPTGWTDVAVMVSGEKHKSLFNKLSTMAKNVRWLYKMLGTTNISSIGGGTLTGAISALNTGLAGKAPSSHTHNYLPLSGGTLSGHLVLNNSKAIQSKDSSGALCQLLVFNSSNNFHIGPYVESTQKPTVYLHGGGSEYEFTSTSFHPGISNTGTLGKSNKLWQAVYAKNGTIQTSDRTKKHDIKDIPDKYIDLFYKLKPRIYMFNDGDRIHVGAISQDVEEAMESLDMSAMDFGGFCKDIRYEYEHDEDGCEIESSKKPVTDENGNDVYDYSIRYQEFIFMHIEATHRLKKENKLLKEELKLQKEEIDLLKKSVSFVMGKVGK